MKGNPSAAAGPDVKVVLTHHITDDPTDPTVTYIDDLHTAVRTASDAAGHKHLNVVSAHTARQCLADGLLDEILVPIPAVAFTFVAPHAEKTDELRRESTPVPAACR